MTEISYYLMGFVMGGVIVSFLKILWKNLESEKDDRMMIKCACELMSSISRYRELWFVIEKLQGQIDKLIERRALLMEKAISDYKELQKDPKFTRLFLIDVLGLNSAEFTILERSTKDADIFQNKS